LRLFTAIELSKEAKKELERLQYECKKRMTCRRWQTLEQMHLTLHFLGELSSEDAALVKQKMSEVTASISPFTLQLDDIGAFPNTRRPRVIWAGISGQISHLDDLQQALSARLQQVGLYKEERKYSPHITLGREPGSINGSLENDTFPKPRPVTWNVDHIVLFQSTLTPKGPIYKAINTYPL
jgi:2'-5' RNA ligase